jgi:hypothetical protein
MATVEVIGQLIKLLAIVGAVAVMIIGLFLIFSRLKAKGESVGPNSLRTISVVLFVPALLMLAVLTEFKTETLAALFGVVVGYALSKPKLYES